jgi:hypothetical protein
MGNFVQKKDGFIRARARTWSLPLRRRAPYPLGHTDCSANAAWNAAFVTGQLCIFQYTYTAIKITRVFISQFLERSVGDKPKYDVGTSL